MRHRLIPVALAAGASLALLAGTAMAATPTWTVVPSVNPSATTLNAVSARTATDAWAVGQFPGAGEDAGSQIFAERWNGTQWQQVPTPNIVRQDERLLGVSERPGRRLGRRQHEQHQRRKPRHPRRALERHGVDHHPDAGRGQRRQAGIAV